MKAIILAGGKTHLPGKYRKVAKSLIEIDGRPLLDYQIEFLRKNKFNDIKLSLYHKADEILKHLKKKDKKADISKKRGKVAGVEYIIGPKALGTGGAIRNAAKGLKKDFLVMNGDVLCNLNLKKFVKFYKKNISEPRIFPSSGFSKTYTPRILPLKVSPLRKRVSHEDILGAMAVYYTQNPVDMGLVKTKNNRVTEFIEKPDYQYSGYINAGFYILSPKVFETKGYKSKKLTDSFAVEEVVFPELAEENQLLAYVHRGLWVDVDTEGGPEKAKEILEKIKEE
ncbi:MAG: NTP transferase domain-containing protein [Candidatus Portnoybacteria bacterium]|nr:NTP transferase domain-containing protein [Candidatus Portnoybacteria bacterium]